MSSGSCSGSSSGSESGSGSSRSGSGSSSSEDRRRKRERRERKRERRRAEKREAKSKRAKKEKKHKKEKKEKKGKKGKKEKKHKREKEQVQRSIITGKRIMRAEGDVADAAGEARRAALLEHMNEGEGVVWAPGPSAASSRRAPDPRTDPAAMRRLLDQDADAKAAKRQRLGSLSREGGHDGYGPG